MIIELVDTNLNSKKFKDLSVNMDNSNDVFEPYCDDYVKSTRFLGFFLRILKEFEDIDSKGSLNYLPQITQEVVSRFPRNLGM
jgi:hypothetical protein